MMYTCKSCQTAQSWQPLDEDICDDCWTKQRLEYLRNEIINERISYNEIAELQELKDHIPTEDVLLLEWAGIPENLNN